MRTEVSSLWFLEHKEQHARMAAFHAHFLNVRTRRLSRAKKLRIQEGTADHSQCPPLFRKSATVPLDSYHE